MLKQGLVQACLAGRAWFGALALAGVAAFHPVHAADAPAAQPASVQWQLPTGYPATNFHTENIQRFADEVKAATNGQLNISLHPNGSLYKMTEIAGAVRGGKVEAGEVMLSSLAKDLPVAGIDSVPFIVRGYADAQVLWRESRSAIEAALAKRGLKLLFAVPWPPQGLYTTKPVTRASSFRGMKMRTYNPATDRIAQLVGAEAVLVQTADLTAALEAGRLDTLITSSATGIDMAPLWKWFPYYYEVNAWLPKNVVFVNQQAFDRLDPKMRTAVVKLAADAEDRGWKISEAKARDYDRQLAAKGTKILSPDPFLIGDFRRLGETLSREWLRAAGDDGLSVLLRYEMNRKRDRS
jgi:TRAP-type C4-dicarboxylate transport system substrate-binding protein